MNMVRTKKQIKDAINVAKRTINVGNYWYWLDRDELENDLDIKQLVYPLRYDVVVRRDFIRFCEKRWQLYEADFESFFLKAMAQPYYTWFYHVYVPRMCAKFIGDSVAINDEYAKRVKATVELYRLISSQGFNPAFPIMPNTGENILKTASGRATGAKYYMADGCHRLACLMVLGYKSIPKEYVRVRCYKTLTPLDNTSILERHINIDWGRAGV
jgi:hypothetical protein